MFQGDQQDYNSLLQSDLFQFKYYYKNLLIFKVKYQDELHRQC